MIARRDAALERIVAYHEAGHAVTRVHLKLRLEKVYLKNPDGGDGGCATYRGFQPKSKSTWRRWYEASVVTAFAGPFAERRYAPRSNWRWGLGYGRAAGCGSDLELIHSYLEKLGYRGRARNAQQAKAAARAAALVRELWPEIKIVAGELLRRKVLTGAEVRRLMNRARRIPRIRRN